MDAIIFLIKWFSTILAIYFTIGLINKLRQQITRLSWVSEDFPKDLNRIKKQIEEIAGKEELAPATIYLISFLRKKTTE